MRKLASALLTLGLVAAAVPASAENVWETCFRDKTNAARKARGIPTLNDHVLANRVAGRHSNEMAADETIYHNRNLPSDLPPFRTAGENVGMGPIDGNDGDGPETGCDVIQEAFMSSPGHRSNVLDRDFTHVGIGVTLQGDTMYVTLDFLDPKEVRRSKPAPQPTECR